MRKWILGLVIATVGLAAAAGTASAGDCFFDRHDHCGPRGRTYGAGYRGYPYGGYGGYGNYRSPDVGYGYYAPAAPPAYYPSAPYRSAYVNTPRLSIGFGY